MPNDEDQLIEGYERNIPDELRDMFYNRWREIKERTTETNIRAIKALQVQVEKHENLLTSFFKQLTVSFSPFIKFDEKEKEKVISGKTPQKGK